MPVFDFESPKGKIISVFLDLNQPSEAYQQQTVDGVLYKRVYTVPNMSVDSRGGTTKQDFVRKTTNKNLKMGEMVNISKEMHLERTQKEGQDSVKEEFYKGYEKRVGQKHKDIIKRERKVKAEASLKKFGVKVNLNQ